MSNRALPLDSNESQYVALGSTPSISGDFTIEFFVKRGTAHGGGAGYQDYVLAGPSNTYQEIEFYADVLQFFLGSTGTNYIVGSETISASTWYHIAIVRSGTTLSYYINGVAGTPTTLNSFSGTFAFANLGSGSAGSTADITLDEVRLWNVARTSGQIAANWNQTMNPSTSGLVAYWNFDESPDSNTTVTDLVAGTYTGTLAGHTTAVRIASTAPFASGSLLPWFEERDPALLVAARALHATQRRRELALALSASDVVSALLPVPILALPPVVSVPPWRAPTRVPLHVFELPPGSTVVPGFGFESPAALGRVAARQRAGEASLGAPLPALGDAPFLPPRAPQVRRVAQEGAPAPLATSLSLPPALEDPLLARRQGVWRGTPVDAWAAPPVGALAPWYAETPAATNVPRGRPEREPMALPPVAQLAPWYDPVMARPSAVIRARAPGADAAAPAPGALDDQPARPAPPRPRAQPGGEALGAPAATQLPSALPEQVLRAPLVISRRQVDQPFAAPPLASLLPHYAVTEPRPPARRAWAALLVPDSWNSSVFVPPAFTATWFWETAPRTTVPRGRPEREPWAAPPVVAQMSPWYDEQPIRPPVPRGRPEREPFAPPPVSPLGTLSEQAQVRRQSGRVVARTEELVVGAGATHPPLPGEAWQAPVRRAPPRVIQLVEDASLAGGRPPLPEEIARARAAARASGRYDAVGWVVSAAGLALPPPDGELIRAPFGAAWRRAGAADVGAGVSPPPPPPASFLGDMVLLRSGWRRPPAIWDGTAWVDVEVNPVIERPKGVQFQLLLLLDVDVIVT